jgi:eukaryotic-like serine/threonine-protein kinase
MTEASPTEFAAGEVLNGNWRLDAIIGKGGMGAVWEATDLKFKRKVAVKTLHPNLIKDEAVRRFEREAQMMARLDHPNVVPLYAFGRERGLPFIVMRFLEGANLRAVVKVNGGLLDWRQFRPLLKQLCDALGYIHSKGVVHRDLKLSNMFIAPDGWLTLLDMGLARGHRSTITHSGLVWGTIDFLSPEQVLAQKVIDGRADLYALGAVTYLVLSGSYAFPEDDDHALMKAHLQAPRPNIAEIAAVPAALGPVLQRAMAIKKEERYQTAAELFDAVDAAFGGATALVTTPSGNVAGPVPTEPEREAAGGRTQVDAPVVLPAPRKPGTTEPETPSPAATMHEALLDGSSGPSPGATLSDENEVPARDLLQTQRGGEVLPQGRAERTEKSASVALLSTAQRLGLFGAGALLAMGGFLLGRCSA